MYTNLDRFTEGPLQGMVEAEPVDVSQAWPARKPLGGADALAHRMFDDGENVARGLEICADVVLCPNRIPHGKAILVEFVIPLVVVQGITRVDEEFRILEIEVLYQKWDAQLVLDNPG